MNAVITANNAIQTNDENRGGCKFVNKRLNGSMYKNRIFSVMFLPVTEAAWEADTDFIYTLAFLNLSNYYKC